MRTICIAVFLTIAYFKNVDSSIDTIETISTMTSNDGTTISPSSENTTSPSSESTTSPTTANVTSTESSTEFFSSTLTNGSSMTTTTTKEKTTSGVTAESSTADVTTTYTTETNTSADTTTTINETSEPTATTDPEVTSTTDPSATEEQGTSTTDPSATEEQGTGTTDSSTTEEQVTSTTEHSNTPTGSTHSAAETTTHLATEETTNDETFTSPESTVDGTSSESSIDATTSTEETTSSIRTTTMAPTSTTPSNINDIIHVDTANAVMTVSLEVIFISCVLEEDARQNMSDALSEIHGFRSVVIENSESCLRNTNGRKITFKVFLEARVLLENRENITSEINSTVGSISNVKSLLAFKMPDDMCHSDVCREALLEHKGYNCESDSPDGNCSLVSPCHILTCENGGTCSVEANRTHYNSVCKCKEDDMYSFSGIECENKTISWKLWTIIAAGAGGGIIVILLFAVGIICAKRKSMSSKEGVYGYDMGYDDRENLMFEPYLSSHEHHRKPLSKDERMEQTNLQTFDNQGYDQWDPSESKDTYASMDRHFQSPSFQTQITRPKIKTNKDNDDQLTPF
ncbi:uncharacterized protein LOC125680495 [Ostrea edulis]|uniref:uncharacterized protein LOC125680495 n=1 Tax=Ostrea edulis TaxID=37623 RepID=UPI0024AF1899|nr:uncharacterized protein LOC125680495 [Ostrea edulis]